MAIEHYLRSIAMRVNSIIDSTGIAWWDDGALKSLHSWVGHLGRMSVYDPSRLVLRAMQFKNRHYLLRLQDAHGGQCHGRRFYTWRWERNLYGFYGESWITHTIRNDDWASSYTSWLQWRKYDFNTKKVSRNRSSKRFKIELAQALAECVTEESSFSTSSESF